MFFVPIIRNDSDQTRAWNRLFEDGLVDRFFTPVRSQKMSAPRSPALDVTETEGSYTAKLDLPGMSKENVKIDIDGRRVTVEAMMSQNEEKKEEDRVIYSERSLASFSRTFTLPLEVDQASSTAKLEKGVLTIALAKRQASTAKQLTIS
jgi:HSP20 family protein